MSNSIDDPGSQHSLPKENDSSSHSKEEMNSSLLFSVKKGLKRLANLSISDLLEELSSEQENDFLQIWTSFFSEQLQTAEKWCYEMRKRENVPSILSYFLSKAMYQSYPQKEMNLFAWCGVSALRAFQSLPSEERKDKYTLWENKIIDEMISLPITGKSGYDQVLLNQIRAYRIKILGTKEELLFAFQEQKEHYTNKPEEDKRLRLLGWILHDCIKVSCEKLKDKELVKLFSDELKQLAYPEIVQKKDPNLVSCYSKDIEKAEMFLSDVTEVKDLIRAEDFDAALKRGREVLAKDPGNKYIHFVLGDLYSKMSHPKEALLEYMICLKQKPDDVGLQTNIAWETSKFMNDCASSEKPLDQKVQALCYNCFNCLDKVNLLERPSKVYSALLKSLTRFTHQMGKELPPELVPLYLNFVQKWDWRNLMEEDFQGKYSKKNPQIRFPSLAENLATTLYRAAVVRNPKTRRTFFFEYPFVLDYFDSLLTKLPNDQWIPYHYGKLLIEKGEFLSARNLIIQIAQRKMNQFWVWSVLAETFPQESEKQMACFCRALCCNQVTQDEQFLVSVHESLGDILREKGMNPEAYCEYLHVDRVRADKKWPPIRRKFDFQKWAKDLTPSKSNQRLYESFREQAEKIILDQLPNYDGLIFDRYTDQRNGKEMMSVWWKDSDTEEAQVLSIFVHRPFFQSHPGTPVHLWVKKGGRRTTIPKMVLRKEGGAWDVYPKRLGVLVAFDGTKGYSWFSFGANETQVSADWKTFPQLKGASCGDFFKLGLRLVNGQKRIICCIAVFPPDPLPPFVKNFSGTLQIPEGKSVGSVGDVYLSESLLVSYGNGARVAGLAVRTYHRAKQCEYWKAISIKSSPE